MLELQLRRETSRCELINPVATSSSIGSGGSGWAEGISSCDNEDNGKSSQKKIQNQLRNLSCFSMPTSTRPQVGPTANQVLAEPPLEAYFIGNSGSWALALVSWPWSLHSWPGWSPMAFHTFGSCGTNWTKRSAFLSDQSRSFLIKPTPFWSNSYLVLLFPFKRGPFLFQSRLW